MSSPLHGIRVVELTNSQTVAQVGQMLADYGAEVVMIEPPGGVGLRQDFSFPILARGKRSIVLDLKLPAERASALQLVARSDILIDSFRPGVADRLGFHFPALEEANPQLINARIDAWGDKSDLVHTPGYEGLVQARLGHFNTLKVHRAGPAFIASPFASLATTLMTVQGVLAALYERESSGRGQQVRTSMAHAMAGLDISGQMAYTLTKRYPEAFQAAPPYDSRFNPSHGFYAKTLLACTKDGYFLQFSQLEPRLFNAFLHELGLTWMQDDPYWQGLPEFDSAEKNGEFLEVLLDAARQKTLAQWQEVFERNPDVFAEVFRQGSELLHHPQLLHDGSVIEVIDPGRGLTKQIGPNVQFDRTPCVVTKGAPTLDEDRGRVLSTPEPTDHVAAEQHAAPSGKPLTGLTVLEFGVYFAGPFGPTWLTDLGARVIKVEPLSGDPVRSFGGFPEAGGAKVLQGKESIALDLATPEGHAIAMQLAQRADLVMCSFRAGVAERLGISAADLHQVNPDLMYLNAAGFGVDGPYARFPAFAMTISAGSGMAMRNFGVTHAREVYAAMDTRDLRRETLLLSSATTAGSTNPDGISGMTAGVALLLAAFVQRRGFTGQSVYCTMSVSTAALLSDTLLEGTNIGAPNRVDPEVYGFSPLYRLYETSDGWMFLAAPTTQEFSRLTQTLSAYADLSEFPMPSFGRDHESAQPLAEQLERVFREKPAVTWQEELLEAGIGCMAVQDTLLEREIFGEFGEASGFVTRADNPIFGFQDRIRPIARFSRSQTQAMGGCSLGQHTVSILRELGRSDEEIQALRAASLIVVS